MGEHRNPLLKFQSLEFVCLGSAEANANAIPSQLVLIAGSWCSDNAEDQA